MLAPYDFATGNTNPESFPTEELQRAAAAAIPRIATELNIYPGELGHEGLRRLMAERERDREGVALDPDHLVLTNGSMQAITLVADALCERREDNLVVMEELNYPGTIRAFRSAGIRMIGVPVDGGGMRVDALAQTLQRLHDDGTPPRFVYTLPTYQNPTGAVMSLERRHALLDAARRFETIVVEDNCYGDVHFDGDKPPALYALDDSHRIVYLCSLSKIFAPGVRLGYLYARAPLLRRILDRRHDAGPNTFAAAVMSEYLEGRLWEHCTQANERLRRKRDAMLAGLESSLGNACSWSHPVGGLFVWVRLPGDVSIDELEVLAGERGVRFARGSNFHIHGEPVPYIRLAFGFPSEDAIRAGIARLGECIEDLRTRAA